MPKNPTLHLCPVCGAQRRPGEMLHGELIRSSVTDLIRQKHPSWTTADEICLSCANHFRTEYVEDLLEKEKGELSQVEEEVVDSLRDQEILTEDVNKEFERQLTFGERLADHIAEFGGSWTFIIAFTAILISWIVLNSAQLLKAPFDPYPYILLNLVLSCLAAVQAPIIMMSQNRQEDRDRLRAENDYQVNLKAELEIRLLNGKIDQMLTHQWQRLLEIQRIQMEMLSETTRPPRRKET